VYKTVNQFFAGSAPDVLLLFILSHGTSDGKIETDSGEFFTTKEVIESLKSLKNYKNCLKLVFFGVSSLKIAFKSFDQFIEHFYSLAEETRTSQPVIETHGK
jgi:hypothetical protein